MPLDAMPAYCSVWLASQPQDQSLYLARLRRVHECLTTRIPVGRLRLDLRFLAHHDVVSRLATLENEMMKVVVSARVHGVHERIVPVHRQVATGNYTSAGASRCAAHEKANDKENPFHVSLTK